MEMEDGFNLDALADMIDDEDIDDPESTKDIKCSLTSNNSGRTNSQMIIQKEEQQTDGKNNNRQIKPVDLFSGELKDTDSCSQKDNSKDSSLNALSIVHSGETDSSDDENAGFLTEGGKTIKKQLTSRKSYDVKPEKHTIKTWKDVEPSSERRRGFTATGSKESYTVDEFSGIRIINPLVSRSVMKTRMEGRRMIKMSYIRNFMRKGDIEGDWVTIGVLIHKSAPKTAKNGKTFSIWRMTDLHDVEKPVSVFLFGSVHVEHWKTAIGTVVGILNPSFLPNRDGFNPNEVSLSVDHAGKFMIVGTSKDFGFCKGRRKDSSSCTSVVNKSQCEFCSYHVSKEYKKLSGKRIELQASYSGNQPNLKNKILKGQNVMYGGQLFSNPKVTAATNSRKAKDKLRLNNLTLKRKAEALEMAERSHSSKNLSDVHGIETIKEITSESQFINRQLGMPSVGSKNLFRHLVKKEKAEIVKKHEIVSVTPKELLKMHEQQVKMKRRRLQESPAVPAHTKIAESILSVSEAPRPQLGRGLQPGDEICFDAVSFGPKKIMTAEELAKLRAIRKIKEKGPLKQQNPNAVKSDKTPESAVKIQLSLERDIEPSKSEDATQNGKDGVEKGMLGSIDFSSERIARLLNRKSSHAYELEVRELEEQEMYFRTLEKKEQMEEKMLSTTELVCDVVSCKICKYTAHKATDLCKNENHPLRCHKAVKRFFECTHCKRRTCAFTKLPTRPCRNCGESSFERTAMMKPRSGPKLENETLNLRGDEAKFLNSLK